MRRLFCGLMPLQSRGGLEFRSNMIGVPTLNQTSSVVETDGLTELRIPIG